MAAGVNISGTILDVGGNPVQGKVVFTLVAPGWAVPRITGSAVLAPLVVTATANGSGVWSAVLYGNDQITPAGTQYSVTIYGAGGQGPISSGSYLLNSGTYDLSNLSPT